MSKITTARRLVQAAIQLLKASTERVASITDDDTLLDLIYSEIESAIQDDEDEALEDKPGVNIGNNNQRAIEQLVDLDKVEPAAEAFNRAVYNAVSEWVSNHMAEYNTKSGPLRGMTDFEEIADVMMELRGGAGYLYFMEHGGAGVGTWDGDWDVLFLEPKVALKEQAKFVKSKTKKEFQALEDAIHNAAYDAVEEFKRTSKNRKMN